MGALKPIPISIDLATIQGNIQKVLPQIDLRDQIRRILNDKGASLEETLDIISTNMRFSSDEQLRQKAAEKVLELHGVTKDSHGDMTINIVCPENVNLANILNPKRDEIEA